MVSLQITRLKGFQACDLQPHAMRNASSALNAIIGNACPCTSECVHCSGYLLAMTVVAHPALFIVAATRLY